MNKNKNRNKYEILYDDPFHKHGEPVYSNYGSRLDLLPWLVEATAWDGVERPYKPSRR